MKLAWVLPALFLSTVQIRAFVNSATENCAEGCAYEQLGDGICQPECVHSACEYDASDCSSCLSQGCVLSMLGNGVCDSQCDREVCGFDHSDCRRSLAATTEVPYKEHNYGLVAGVGLGTFLIIFSGALGLLFCICSFASSLKEVCILVGIAIPLITTCIIVFSPTEKEDRQKTDTRVDNYDIARVLYLICIIPFTLLATFVCIKSIAGIELKTRRVDSRAVGEVKAEKLDLEEGAVNQSLEQPAGAEQALLPLAQPPQ